MLCVSQMSAVFVWQPVRGFPFSCSNVICYHRILREFAFLYAPSSVQQRLHRDICLLSVNIKSKLGSFTFKMCVSDFTVWDSSAHVFGQKKSFIISHQNAIACSTPQQLYFLTSHGQCRQMVKITLSHSKQFQVDEILSPYLIFLKQLQHMYFPSIFQTASQCLSQCLRLRQGNTLWMYDQSMYFMSLKYLICNDIT